MKLELLVIPNQNVGVNTFPGVVHTARHAMGVLVIPNQNVGVNTFPGVVHTARHAMGVCNT